MIGSPWPCSTTRLGAAGSAHPPAIKILVSGRKNAGCAAARPRRAGLRRDAARSGASVGTRTQSATTGHLTPCGVGLPTHRAGGACGGQKTHARGGSAYVFSVFPSRCHPERAWRVEGSRRADFRTTTTTARFLDSLRSLGMTTVNMYGVRRPAALREAVVQLQWFGVTVRRV